MADDILHTTGDDEEIVAAIAEAQRRLPEFRRIVEDNNRHVVPPYGVPMVKICLQDSASEVVEHIWLEGVSFEGSEVVGLVVTEPPHRPGIRKGAECRSASSGITDWMYFEGEKMQGGFVERILMKRAGIDE
ncbi:MAG TPA: DUF2314 domain-containing protein [Planctomycetota bacterium]|nr:DUF2314 domain-containing protein [Planctomycetota bacterium]